MTTSKENIISDYNKSKNGKKLINTNGLILSISINDLYDIIYCLENNPNIIHYSEFGKREYYCLQLMTGYFNECNENNINDFIYLFLKIQELIYKNKKNISIKILFRIRMNTKNQNRHVCYIVNKDIKESKGDINLMPKILFDFVIKREFFDSCIISLNDNQDEEDEENYSIYMEFFCNAVLNDKYIQMHLSYND